MVKILIFCLIWLVCMPSLVAAETSKELEEAKEKCKKEANALFETNETENPQKERFGNDRLLAALRGTNFESAQQVIESMKQEVETFRSGAEPNDDLTMMCVCVGPQTKG